MHARTFSLTSFETQSSSCDYITESDFLLSGIAMVSYNVLLCWAQLVIFFYFFVLSQPAVPVMLDNAIHWINNYPADKY